MDIPRRAPRLNLPEDCHKLDISICEDPKFENKCVINYAKFGGTAKCVVNETYLIDYEIREKGFRDFAKLDINNLEEDMLRRDELCRSLSPNACRSSKAKILGCEYTKGFFTKGRCKLADKIINYYYTTNKTCLCKSCNEDKERGFKLCNEHRREFNELVEHLNDIYKEIVKKKNIESNYANYINIYADLTDRFNIYLVENPGTLIQLTEKYNEMRSLLGEKRCQCINISTCIGNGEIDNFCTNKGIKTMLGLICNEHKKCFTDRRKKFEDFKNRFESLCTTKSCKAELDELNNFYKMIMFCTEGDSFLYKQILLDYIFIIRQYIRELSP